MSKNKAKPAPAKRHKLSKKEEEARRILREEKRALKERDAKELKELLAKARELTRRIPAEYQQLDYSKTNVYKRLIHFTRHAAGLKHPKLAVIRECVRLLEGHATWTDSEFSKLKSMSDTARKLPYDV